MTRFGIAVVGVLLVVLSAPRAQEAPSAPEASNPSLKGEATKQVVSTARA